MFKKKLLQFLPYFAVVVAGAVLYFLAATITNTKFSALLTSIAAAFFAIPLLFLFYELVKTYSHKKLNQEIFDYAKMQMDRELIYILMQLRKSAYILEEKSSSIKEIKTFLFLKMDELENQLKANKYLGFQVFKNWEISEKGLNELLKNPFILEKMKDENVISIISILKNLRALDSIQKIEDLYLVTNEVAKGYKIQSGAEININNRGLPDRYLLLKHLSEDKFVVCDFGDISKYNLEKCLKYYKINDDLLNYYAEAIFNVLNAINSWLETTGWEFIIDTKMFRMRSRLNKSIK